MQYFYLKKALICALIVLFSFNVKSQELKIVYFGSSVPYGAGATNHNGYTSLFSAILKNRVSTDGKVWKTVNISIPGDNTVRVLNRYKTDLLPQNGKYVIFALALGNEGIHEKGQPMFDQFEKNMKILIGKARSGGYVPVITNSYTRNDYNEKDYHFIKKMNLLIQGWAVPSINLLGAVDDLSGHWVNGFWADEAHPNDAGHAEMAYTIVPSLFDALESNKPIPKSVKGSFIKLTKNGSNSKSLAFTPEHIVHPFTTSVSFKAGNPGAILQLNHVAGTGTVAINKEGRLVYSSPTAGIITGTSKVNDDKWHKVTLTHYYAKGITLLYCDSTLQGTVKERLVTKGVKIGGTGIPKKLAYKNWLFYRSAMNLDEIKYLAKDSLLKSSLELYAPLDGRKVSVFDSLINLAQSTNTIKEINTKIDRRSLVKRHNLNITDKNLNGPSQVGNGRFAFGFDITGLQTFSDNANTMSDWGWHKFPEPSGQSAADFKGQEWDTQGRLVRYDIQNPNQQELTKWMIANPHRLNLGRFGLILKKKDGSLVVMTDLQDANQKLDLWTGIATSTFKVDGKQIKVTTVGDPGQDAVAVKIEAEGLNDGQVGVFLDFPNASHAEFGSGADWNTPDQHHTQVIYTENSAVFNRKLDNTKYTVKLAWGKGAKIKNTKPHRYELIPMNKNVLEMVLSFSKKPLKVALPTFAETKRKSELQWENFWNSGGAIDLSGSKDPRWMELERRIVLSQYVMAVNEIGSLPPQESGLVNNGWFGKYHFEMIWWHEAHYALWGRLPLMDKCMGIYTSNLKTSKRRAKEQGYSGARWPKTVGDQEHWEWPNEINPLLIWQQPHPIFFAELEYRTHPTQKTLKKWGNVVIETANFMASYPYYNKQEDRYILGYPLQVVSENANPRSTFNPTFELSYWRTGLRLAQKWRKRLKLPAEPKYAEVLSKLSKLPVQDGKYVSWEKIDSMWTKFNFEHPALIGAYGMLPGDGVDIPMMERTFNKVGETWRFDRTWGWDFPMLAMCAARLGHGDKAIDYLLNYPNFKVEEHGLVGGGGPFPYFPGNGGLLYAVAMMAAGWDGAPGINAPGFPKDGQWVVKWEGLKSAL